MEGNHSIQVSGYVQRFVQVQSELLTVLLSVPSLETLKVINN